MILFLKHIVSNLGGCDTLLKAADETDLLSQIEQHELELPPEELIEKLTKNHYVTVFDKSNCKYSKRLKTFFKNKNVDFKVVDLDTLGDLGKEVQKKLFELTGQYTVPNVWVNGKFIGKQFLSYFKLLKIISMNRCN